MIEEEIIAEAKKIYFRSQFMQFLREARGIKEDDLKKLVKEMKGLILSLYEPNPYTLLFNVLKKCEEIWPPHVSMPIHGEWHHILVPGVVLTAMRNNHYPISDQDIMEGIERGEMGKVSCGFSGTCGAANGVGIVAAIVKKSTPHHDEERQEIMQLVANSQQEISQIMRRCCKRSTYIGIQCAVNYLDRQGYSLQTEEFKCPYSPKNSRCARKQCPYYPAS
ncbi:MAG: DUF5714 domain-containing protein [Thermodesulfobacteriota bacterium]